MIVFFVILHRVIILSATSYDSRSSPYERGLTPPAPNENLIGLGPLEAGGFDCLKIYVKPFIRYNVVLSVPFIY